MPEFKRVKDKSTGHKYTIVASAFDENAHQELKQDAVDNLGVPLPAEHADLSSSGQTATTSKKEQS